jgi:hypothetical protein
MTKAKGKAVIHAKRHIWLFSWRRSFRRRWSLALAALIVLPMMVLMLTFIRVRVFPLAPSLNRSGEMVMLIDSPENRDWLAQISQKTPFPQIDEAGEIEQLSIPLLQNSVAASGQSKRDLRAVTVGAPLRIFSQYHVWPALPSTEQDSSLQTPPSLAFSWVQPRLKLLAKNTIADLPQHWPTYHDAQNEYPAGMQFLLEIDAKGKVKQCLSVSKDPSKRNVSLENWLMLLEFPKPERVKGWLGCEVIWEKSHD